MSHMPGELFNLYLHQNYVDFFTEVDDLVRASEFLSFADILSGDWNVRLKWCLWLFPQNYVTLF